MRRCNRVDSGDQNQMVYCVAWVQYRYSGDFGMRFLKTIDEVHKHYCDNTTYSGYKMLFEIKNMWIESVKHYVQMLIKTVNVCH